MVKNQWSFLLPKICKRGPDLIQISGNEIKKKTIADGSNFIPFINKKLTLALTQ
jgi:hypothetical protein